MKTIKACFFLSFLIFSCQQEKEIQDNVKEQKTAEHEFTAEEENRVVQNQFIFPKVPDQIEFAGEIIPLEDLDIYERFDRELVVNNFWHSNTIFYFKRANRWFPLMREILIEEGIPEDFLYLAVIESGLTQARSPSNALGFWQFLKGTAIDYGLKVDHQIDERMHVAKSTRAACKYLKNAYKQFGSWTLAAAAYNRGKAGINNALEAQQVDNLFDLMLNEETARYVFRIVAVKLIMESPESYGFLFTNDDLYQPYDLKTIQLTEGVYDLVSWSIENGINYKILKILNPWIISKTLTIRSGDMVEVYLPNDTEQLAPFSR